MKPITIRNAFYIKLGRGGEWEWSSIQENRLRIGWKKTELTDINKGNWTKIEKELKRESKNNSIATRDYHALRWIVESSSDDVW